MEKYKFSINQLVIRAKCSRSLVNNYRSDYYNNYSLDKILLLSSTMKLMPYETYQLTLKAGYDLDAETFKEYRNLVVNHWNEGTEKWNKILISRNKSPLYKKVVFFKKGN